MTAIPPPRWKVVERGRRLEVIDTATGLPLASGMAARPDMISADRGATLATRRFYDAKGPRVIALDTAAQERLGRVKAVVAAVIAAWLAAGVFMPLFLIPVLGLLQPKVRQRLRDVATKFIDTLEPGRPY